MTGLTGVNKGLCRRQDYCASNWYEHHRKRLLNRELVAGRKRFRKDAWGECRLHRASADPVLDPLVVTQRAPAPGVAVTVTAVVRNVGRGSATNIALGLYRGEPGSGALLATITLTQPLRLNETFTAVTATGREETFYAELMTIGQNASTMNDRVTLRLGQLSTPVIGGMVESEAFVDGLVVAWTVPPDEYISSYRILRSSTTEGLFELIGEASETIFTDTPVERGRSYCYAVQAYNANSFSLHSEAVCGELPSTLGEVKQRLYLPLVSR